ncbi:hypothetical protein H5410_057994, partial [Solanum commersonii]
GIEDENDLVQALKDDLLGILKGGDPIRIPSRLIETATQLHINHAQDYASLTALIEDVKSICQGEPATLVADQVHWRKGHFREGSGIEEKSPAQRETTTPHKNTKIEDENDLVQALKDDLLGILKGADPLQGLVKTATQLHINHTWDYAPLMALIEDVKSICQGEPATLVADQVR